MELDEKSSKKVEWEKILFNQIDRILVSMSIRSPDFPSSVEALKSALKFFSKSDKSFLNDVLEIDAKAERMVEELRDQSGKISPESYDSVAWTRAKFRFEVCLELMGRAGFYPERQAEFDDKKVEEQWQGDSI